MKSLAASASPSVITRITFAAPGRNQADHPSGASSTSRRRPRRPTGNPRRAAASQQHPELPKPPTAGTRTHCAAPQPPARQRRSETLPPRPCPTNLPLCSVLLTKARARRPRESISSGLSCGPFPVWLAFAAAPSPQYRDPDAGSRPRAAATTLSRAPRRGGSLLPPFAQEQRRGPGGCRGAGRPKKRQSG